MEMVIDEDPLTMFCSSDIAGTCTQFDACKVKMTLGDSSKLFQF